MSTYDIIKCIFLPECSPTTTGPQRVTHALPATRGSWVCMMVLWTPSASTTTTLTTCGQCVQAIDNFVFWVSWLLLLREYRGDTFLLYSSIFYWWIYSSIYPTRDHCPISKCIARCGPSQQFAHKLGNAIGNNFRGRAINGSAFCTIYCMSTIEFKNQ